MYTAILSVTIRIIEVVAIIMMYIAAVKGCRRAKELQEYVTQLEIEKNDSELKKARVDYKMIADLNAVSKYLIDNLPRVYETYKVPMNLKKYLVDYLRFFAEYDKDEFEWLASRIKNFNNCDSVAAEAKLVHTHITKGTVKKERALQAIVYLIIKAKS
jgi:hypothetical protein